MKKHILPAIALGAFALAGAQTENLVLTDTEGNTHYFPVDNIEGVIFEAAPHYTSLSHLLGLGYSESEGNGIFRMQFGTAEPGPDGECAAIGDIQLQLDLVAPKTADLSQPVLPEGYYRIGNGKQPWTYDVQKSILWVRAEEGDEGINPLMLVDGTVDVRCNGDQYDIRIEMLTMGGEVNLRYKGSLPFPQGVSDYEAFTEPLDLNFQGATGRFYGNWFYPFAADLTLQFYLGDVVDGVMKEGYILDLYLNEPKPEDCMNPLQKVADGVYTPELRPRVNDSTYLPFTFEPGEKSEVWGSIYMTKSHVTYTDAQGHRKLGNLTDGTVTVSGGGTHFVFDLLTEEGISVKGVYDAAPDIHNFCDNDEKEPQRPYSSLTEDRTFNVLPTTLAMQFNNGHYITMDTYTQDLFICDPEMTNGDYLDLLLLTETEELNDGVYTIDNVLEPGHGIIGMVNYGGSPVFSWYGDLDDIDEEGYNLTMGPVASGTVSISTCADGTRDFVLDLRDDAGHSITGSFNLVFFDLSDTEEDTQARVRPRRVLRR